MPTSASIEYTSFLVRLWREVGDERLVLPTAWQAEVEHIQTGERWRFETLEQLLDFLGQQPGNRDQDH